MANPNLAAASSVYVANSFNQLTTTTETQIVSNASGSGKAYLVDSIVVANVDGSNAAEVTLNIYANATNGGTVAKLVSTVSVPADSSIVIVSKDQGLCLTENQSVYAQASAANRLHAVAFWKELS